MDKELSCNELRRLLEEAPRIAPSIAQVIDNNYGRVTDDGYDAQAAQRWSLEAVAILQLLASSQLSAFVRLNGQLYALEAERFHSRSIYVHKVSQCLQTALQLIDSPVANALPWPFPSSAEAVKEESLPRPDRVTIPWLLRHVPATLWVSGAGLLIAAFTVGVKACQLTLIQEIFGVTCK